MLRFLAICALLAAPGCALGNDGIYGRGGGGDTDAGQGGWDVGDGGDPPIGDAGDPGSDAGTPPPPPPQQDAGPPPPTCTAARACTTTCGSQGTQPCVGGAYGACAAPAEVCNGADDDCDGAPDDGFACAPGATQACTTSCGSAGVRSCGMGCAWDACAPPAETCNGADDDCDGITDDGALCTGGDECRAGRCQQVEWIFEAEGPGMGHGVGRAEADGWSASTPIDGSGTLVYGPYTSALPPGVYEVRYRMMIDNRTANDDVVARIDVNDFDGGSGNCGTCVITSREIRRMSFAAPMVYQDFVLTFSAPAGHRLEFRTTWTDRAYIRQDRVTVRAL